MVKDIALVLGGGGSAGHAWTIGVIAGLAEAGIDMTEAPDLVIGTSSGATAAAQVRSGIPPAELLASILSPPVRLVGQNRQVRRLRRVQFLAKSRRLALKSHIIANALSTEGR